MKLDNTMAGLFQDCPLKYATRIEGEWTSRFRSGALGHGGAVHEGLKKWYQGMLEGLSIADRLSNAVEAIAINWPENQPIDDFRTLGRAQELMISYARKYPTEPFRVIRVEIPFCYELGRWILWCNACMHENPPFDMNGVATQRCFRCDRELESIEYGGIFDTLISYGPLKASTVYILEHKTTSVLGKTYFHQWSMASQVTGYVWGAHQATGKLIGGAQINALCLTVGGNTNFDRKITTRNLADIERWKNDVASTCNEIAYAKRTGHWRMHSNQCVGKYGLCEFYSVHILADPDEQRRRLETDYRKDKWEFERRDDPVVEA